MYTDIINNVKLSDMQLYFGRDMRPLTLNNVVVKPTFCRASFQSASKPACNQCQELCRHSIEMILHQSKGLSKDDILLELKKHYHPKTRIQDKNVLRQRDLLESKRELADHYIYAHGYTEPVFL
jgi:hypothetical protein